MSTPTRARTAPNATDRRSATTAESRHGTSRGSGTSAPGPTPRWARTLRRAALPVGVVVGLLLPAQLAVTVGLVPDTALPPPTAILGEFVGLVLGSALWVDAGQTVLGWAAALGLAIVVGTAVGLVLGRLALVRAFVTPVVEFLRPIPSIALIPLVILTIGGGKSGEIALASYAALWQMLIAALYASGSVDRVSEETARAFHLGRWHTLRWVTMPSMLPGLATGARIASATSLIIVITSEILIGSPGLGRGLNLARSGGDLERMYAYIIAIGLLGVALNTVLRLVERRLLRGHPGVGGGGAR